MNEKYSNPYLVLGVSENVSDAELKDAYRKLSKQYHPDNHMESPLAELAEEKMAEINAAYDQIMDIRRGKNTGSSQQQTQYTNTNTSSTAEYDVIRRHISSGNVTVADELLERITVRGAEWSFLKGSICYARGWLNDAFTHFSTAAKLEPNNAEYRAALNQMASSKTGNTNNGFGGGSPYRTNGATPFAGCSMCDMCQGLICADCCCECMGGDCISCC